MLKIVFENFNKNLGEILFNVKQYDENSILKNDVIYFKLSEDFVVNDNLLAIALSTFCGVKFDEIYFDLSVHKKIIEDISLFTNAIVKAKSVNTENFPCYDDSSNYHIALNFSGGFDSLAAKVLYGDLVDLVSISFFEIEHDFFKKFNPYILETNFRQLGYAENSWTFMGVGTILFSEYLNLKYHTFGTIFEAFHLHATKEFSSRGTFIEKPFIFAGIEDLKLIQGLTEIGTALVLCNTNPHLVNDSIASLSQPGTEKRYRKQLIIQILKDKFDLKDVYIELTEPPVEEKRLTWGNDYAIDFLSLYLLKHAGIGETSNIMMNIPNDAINFVENHSLEFYEKFNVNFLNNIPQEFTFKIMENLVNAKIFMYNQNDYDELFSVIKFLSNYHDFLEDIL